MLEKAGFTISINANLLFKEEDYIQDSFIGELNGEYEIIHFSKIIYVESFGRNIILHTSNHEYNIREKLYEVEEMLSGRNYIRVSKSTIVAKTGIKRIKPSLNGRINLIMIDNKLLSVSKTYSKIFKNIIGF
jgi:two-component system response regulator LytT